MIKLSDFPSHSDEIHFTTEPAWNDKGKSRQLWILDAALVHAFYSTKVKTRFPSDPSQFKSSIPRGEKILETIERERDLLVLSTTRPLTESHV